MSPRVVNLASVVLVVLGAALWAAAPTLLGLPEGFSLLLGVGSAVLLQLWRLHRERRRRRHNLISTSTVAHRISKDFEPIRDLGLHSSSVAIEAASIPVPEGTLPPYVPGRIDGAIATGLARRSFTLVIGNSLSGKSRASFEAIRSLLPDAEIWVPNGPDGLRALLRCDPPLATGWRPVVVWLDDIERCLGRPPREAGVEVVDPYPDLGAALFQRHISEARWWSAWRPRVLFVATIDRRRLDQIADPGNKDAADRRLLGVMALAEQAELGDGDSASWDMKVAASLYPTVDFSVGIGRAFAQGDLLVDAYRSGAEPIGRALVRAAVDWQRVGFDGPSSDWLRHLLPVELPGQYVDDARFTAALNWANRELPGSQRLLIEQGKGEIPSFEAHPYLLAADDGYGPDAEQRPVPDAVWDLAATSLDAARLFGVAEIAGERDPAAAERILSRLADDSSIPGSTPVARQMAEWLLGDLYADRPGYEDVAEVRLTAAIAGPDPDIQIEALLSRGRLLDRLGGREAEAAEDYVAAQAVTGADPAVLAGARHELGRRHQKRGKHELAIASFTEVVDEDAAPLAIRGMCLVKRGLSRQDLGQNEAAFADFTATIELAGGPESIAIAYIERSELADTEEQMLSDLASAIAVTGASPRYRAFAHCIRAERLVEMGRIEEAAEDYDAACTFPDLEPEDRANFSLHRADFYEERDPRRAKQEYRGLIETPGLSRAHLAAAYVGLGIMHFGEITTNPDRDFVGVVASDMERAVELGDSRTRSRAQYWLARLHEYGYGTDRWALRLFGSAIEAEDADEDVVASAYIHRAALHKAYGRTAEALADLCRGIEVPGARGHTHAVGLANRGHLRLLDFKDAVSAEADYRAALWTSEGSEVSAGCLGHIVELLRSQGRQAEELSLYRAALATRRVELVGAALVRLEELNRRRSWRMAWQARRLLRRAQQGTRHRELEVTQSYPG